MKKTTDEIKRTGEIEEFTNLYIIHPISSWLVPQFIRLNITPNMVSSFGMVCGLLSGFCYYHYQNPLFAVLGFALMFLWHIFDGADGQLARATQNFSEIGKVIDGICDYVTFISVYVGLSLALVPLYGTKIWYLSIFAGICHAIQSGAYELQRSEYDFWGKGKQGADLPNINEMIESGKEKSALGQIANQLHIGYIRMQYVFSGVDLSFRNSLKQLLGLSPENEDKLRELYREIYAPAVNNWSLLCANYRTFAIFLASISGEPQYYFWFEIIVLNLTLIFLAQKQKLLNNLFILRLKEII
ncbi:MAG TPA: CDP-alcohol phosphatidyltransferase family protein [Emcibacteraceae bacterium]|nr:CDP-alcohol phosphatidyltransferase family protein [Emcibacteraceae bacterium]HRW29002.1 CDP-alcohol phosphatidyltransferase family protein [Emcibacteraceae bacterium]